MKKILIWDYTIPLQNSGGPAGYLYNIHENILNSNDREIVFLNDLIGKEYTGYTTNKLYLKLNKYDFLKLFDRIWVVKRVLMWRRQFLDEQLKRIDFSQYSVIHFHQSFDVYTTQELLKDYKGIKLLTSHSPQPISAEIVEHIRNKYSIIRHLSYRILEKKELKAWSIVDYLMFPVKPAIEPYLSSHSFRVFYQNNSTKFVYCASSIENRLILKTSGFYEARCNIPSDCFIITFIGRHNEIKGYDQLKKIGQAVLEKYPNVYIVVAGLEAPLKGLNNKRWIELGWIKDGPDVIVNSDVFILPNKETYFDLVALEVLRTGTPIIMSKTGGNKYFEDLSSGIVFYDYDDITGAIKAIEKMFEAKRSGIIAQLREENRKLFEEQFTVEAYIKRYKVLISQIAS